MSDGIIATNGTVVCNDVAEARKEGLDNELEGTAVLEGHLTKPFKVYVSDAVKEQVSDTAGVLTVDNNGTTLAVTTKKGRIELIRKIRRNLEGGGGNLDVDIDPTAHEGTGNVTRRGGDPGINQMTLQDLAVPLAGQVDPAEKEIFQTMTSLASGRQKNKVGGLLLSAGNLWKFVVQENLPNTAAPGLDGCSLYESALRAVSDDPEVNINNSVISAMLALGAGPELILAGTMACSFHLLNVEGFGLKSVTNLDQPHGEATMHQRSADPKPHEGKEWYAIMRALQDCMCQDCQVEAATQGDDDHYRNMPLIKQFVVILRQCGIFSAAHAGNKKLTDGECAQLMTVFEELCAKGDKVLKELLDQAIQRRRPAEGGTSLYEQIQDLAPGAAGIAIRKHFRGSWKQAETGNNTQTRRVYNEIPGRIGRSLEVMCNRTNAATTGIRLGSNEGQGRPTTATTGAEVVAGMTSGEPAKQIAELKRLQGKQDRRKSEERDRKRGRQQPSPPESWWTTDKPGTKYKADQLSDCNQGGKRLNDTTFRALDDAAKKKQKDDVNAWKTANNK